MNHLHIFKRFYFGLFLATTCVVLYSCIKYPHPDPPPLPTAFSAEEESLAKDLKAHVIAQFAVERNVKNQPGNLKDAAEYIEKQVTKSVGIKSRPLPYHVPKGDQSRDLVKVRNIEVTIEGTGNTSEVIVIGAHYDSALTFPGANDNGSGTAAALELVRLLSMGKHPKRTIRIVFFTNEEEPYFDTKKPAHEWMGSRQYAKAAKYIGDNIIAMFSLETMGYFTEDPESQCLSARWLPKTDKADSGPQHRQHASASDTKLPLVECKVSGKWLGKQFAKGNFIAFIGDLRSRQLVHKSVTLFRDLQSEPKMRAEGIAMTTRLEGVDWSDHRSFWNEDFYAVMITDTAPLRYPYYHWNKDTPEHINYNILAKIVLGLEKMIRHMANE